MKKYKQMHYACKECLKVCTTTNEFYASLGYCKKHRPKVLKELLKAGGKQKHEHTRRNQVP